MTKLALRAALSALGAAISCAALPGVAWGAILDASGSTLVYSSPGSGSSTTVFAEKELLPGGPWLKFSELGDDEITITAAARGAGCKYFEEAHADYEAGDPIMNPEVAVCTAAPAIRADLGDGDDNFGVASGDDAILQIPFELNGGPGDDVLRGGNAADTLRGGDGTKDRLLGYAGDDRLYGEGGADELTGMEGNDLLDGGDGDDSLEAIHEQMREADWAGADDLIGGPGADSMDYYLATQPVSITLDDQANDGYSGEGDNVRSDIETVTGGPKDDTIVGNAGPNRLYGDDGNDTIDGGAGDDAIDGELMNDTISGGPGADTIHGNQGNDKIDAGAGTDSVFSDPVCNVGGDCGGLDEIAVADGEKDKVTCGAWDDKVTADAIDDVDKSGQIAFNCESITIVSVDPCAQGCEAPCPKGTQQNPPLCTPTTALVAVPKKLSLKRFLKRGLVLQVTCPESCKAALKLTVPKGVAKKLGLKSRTIGKATKQLAAGDSQLKVRVDKKAKKRLRKLKKLKLTVSGTAGGSKFKRTVSAR